MTTKTQNSDATIHRFINRYERNGRAISVDFRKLVREIRSPDRATHFLHPYPAKLLVQIPYFFLSNRLLSKPGDNVLDPFCGSGTVLLESQLAGRNAFGAECNPLARLITLVKTTPLSSQILRNRFANLVETIPETPTTDPPEIVNRDHWFYPHVIRQLTCIRESIEKIPTRSERNFFLVCFSNCASKVSLADPKLAVPVKLKPGKYSNESPHRQRIESHLRRLKRVNVQKVFTDIVEKNISRMQDFKCMHQQSTRASLVSEDARNLTTVESTISPNSMSLIITSPPYPGAQKYVRSSTFGLGWLDLCKPHKMLDLKRITIGREEYRKSEIEIAPDVGIPEANRCLQKIQAKDPVRSAIAGFYLLEMQECLSQMFFAVRPGGFLVLVASNNQISGLNFQTVRYNDRRIPGLSTPIQIG